MLLTLAGSSDEPRLVRLADGVAEAVHRFRAEWVAAGDRVKARAEVARLEQQLAEAKRKLRPPSRIKDSGRPARVMSDAGRVAVRANGLRLQHGKGRHEGKPNPDCPSCSEVT